MRTPLLNMSFRFGGAASASTPTGNATSSQEDEPPFSPQTQDNSHNIASVDEPTIFQGTPLADYASNFGMEDWGIDHLGQDDDSDEARNQSDYGKSSVRRIINSKTTMPLMLSSSYSSQPGNIMHKRRFRDILRTALRPRLSVAENNQFLERFKFVYVGSYLLDDNPRLNLSLAKSSNTREAIAAAKAKSDRQKHILFGSNGPWDIRMGPKYWAGAGGGYIVVIVVLLTWRSKTNHASVSSSEPSSKSDNSTAAAATTALVVMLTLGLYLFAHSRRRMVRMLRAKSLAFASKLVHDNETLDRSIGRAIALIREVELITLGFSTDGETAPTCSTIPATRLDHSITPSDRAAKHVRGAVCAVLYLAQCEYSAAIDKCAEKCSYLDLQQYLNIYGLLSSSSSAQDNSEFSVRLEQQLANANSCRITITGVPSLAKEEYYGTLGCTASLAKIKKEFRRFHFMRKAFVCCLLSMSTTGECSSSELDRWSTVVDHLEALCGLLVRVNSTLSRDQLFCVEHQSTSNGEMAHDWQSDVASTTVESPYIRQTADISNAMQRVYARLTRLTDDNADQSSYEMLGSSIKTLLETWEQGNAINVRDQPSPTTDTTRVSETVERRPFQRHMPSISTSTTTSTLVEFEAEDLSSRKPMILEGIAEDRDLAKTSNMSRQARIELMNQRRQAQSDFKKAAKESAAQQQQFVLELGSVLKRRSNVN